MNNANKLALSVYPLILLGIFGLIWLAMSLIFLSKPCWEAAILVAICYGFIVISTNQLNIHSDNIEKHEKVS